MKTKVWLGFGLIFALAVAGARAQSASDLFRATGLKNWQAVGPAEPPAPVALEGIKGCKFSGDFSKVTEDRFCWEMKGLAWDLSGTSSFPLSLQAENAPSVLATLQFISGEGLYKLNLTDLENGWNEITVVPSQLKTEGEPVGLDKINAVRLILWKMSDKDKKVAVVFSDAMDRRLQRVKRFINALSVARELMGDRLLKPVGASGDDDRARLQEMAVQWEALKSASAPGGISGALDQLEGELERLEREMIIESANIFSAPVSVRRAYSTFKAGGESGLARAREINDAMFKEASAELPLDWKRNLEGLKRNGINLDLALEISRFQVGSQEAFKEMIPDRFYEQRYSFYHAVITERQRVAAEALRIGQFLEAWEKVIQLRRQLGARLSGVEPLVAAVKAAVQKFRETVNEEDAYPRQLACERAANEALTRLKTAATAEEDGAPVIWPGASFYSTGRFALGGSWQGILNSEINHNGLYRDKEEFKLDKEGKFGWSFSFAPPGSSRSDFEILDQSWTHSTRRYYYPKKEDPNHKVQEATWSILAPGTLVDTPGPAMELSDTSTGNPVAPDRLVAVLKGKVTLLGPQDGLKTADLTENWVLLLMENGLPTFPVLVVFEQRPDEMAWTKEGLEVRRKEGVGRCVIALPFGAAPLSPNDSKGWKSVPEETLRQVRGVLPLLTYYPLTTDEFFSIENDAVRVWSKVAKAVQLKSAFCATGKPYAPLPPLYAMSLPLNLGLKVDSSLSGSLMMTKYGPYQVTREPLLSYRVPKARMWDRTELRPVGGDADLVNRFNKELFPLNSFECSRFGETGTYMPGYLMMTAENREKARFYKNPFELEAAISGREPIRPQGCALEGRRNISIDPVTGQTYWVFGWRGARHDVRMKGDVPNYAAFWMNGPYCYAKYFGAWDLLERHWAAFRQAYSAVAARHDWAIQGHDCLSTGLIFSGDMVGDGWRSHHMIFNTASIIGGHVEDERLAQYLGSATLLSVATLGHPGTIPYRQRLVNRFGSRNKEIIIQMRAIDTGLCADNGSENGAIAGPGAWHNLYAFSGCQTYDYPMFDGIFTLYPEVGHYQFQGFPRAFPSWLDESYLNAANDTLGSVNNTGSGNYLGYLSWAGTDKKRVAEDWNKYIDLLTKGKIKDYKAYIAYTMICAEYPYFIAQGNPLWLAAWDKAKLDDGLFDRQRQVATIRLTAPRAGALKLDCAAPVQEVKVNGQPLAEKQWVYRPEKQDLEVPFPEGKAVVSIQLQNGAQASFAPGVMKFARSPALVAVTASPLIADFGLLSIPVLTGDLKVGNVIPIDLTAVVNRGFYDDPTPGGVRGTHDDGESWEVPKGQVVLRGVPFTLIDPAENKGKTCLVLKGAAKSQFPEQVTNIRVDRRVKRLFFFHGTAYTQTDPGAALTYVLKFKTAGTRELNMRVGQQIAEWKIPEEFKDKSLPLDRLPDLPDARGSMIWPAKPDTKHYGLGVGGYIYAWENNVKEAGVSAEGGIQRGLDALDSIDIISSGKSVPLVFAISAEPAE